MYAYMSWGVYVHSSLTVPCQHSSHTHNHQHKPSPNGLHMHTCCHVLLPHAHPPSPPKSISQFHINSDQKIWSTAGGGSGLGSSLDYTANIRKQLTDVLTRYKISSMLDSSCGSMHWMPLVLKEHEQKTPGFKFMGTDVVCSLIEKHKVTFANQTNWQFQVCIRW